MKNYPFNTNYARAIYTANLCRDGFYKREYLDSLTFEEVREIFNKRNGH